jgi:hypothetical protein
VAVAVSGFKEFFEHYQRARSDDLAAFFLYSSRSSQKSVATFAEREFAFLNELAINQNMFFYVFKMTKTNSLLNPSGEVSRIFNIPASSLPGILVFTVTTSLSKAQAIFFPIPTDLFLDREKAESRLSQLFDEIGRARRATVGNEAVIAALSKALPRWRSTDRWRPLLGYASRESQKLVNLPSDLLKKIAEGFAKGLISTS